MSKAYELIRLKKNWCQGRVAVNEDGFQVEPGDKEACAWCALGALLRIYPCHKTRERIKNRLKMLVGGCIPRWNDHKKTKHKDVVRLLKEAESGEE